MRGLRCAGAPGPGCYSICLAHLHDETCVGDVVRAPSVHEEARHQGFGTTMERHVLLVGGWRKLKSQPSHSSHATHRLTCGFER